MSRENRNDDLFTPSLEGVRRAPLPSGERPWRLGSQFYIAFFGGPLAAAAIGWMNAKRLGLSGSRRLAIAGIGAAGMLVTILLVIAFDLATNRSLRLVIVAVGVACYLATRELQKPADRRYAAGRNRDAYGSLWLRGIVTTIAWGFVAGIAAAVAVS